MTTAQLLHLIKLALPGLDICENEPLAPHTSFGIGGPAELFARPKSPEELGELYRLCLQENVAPVILGSGTNVLIPDGGIRGLVIHTKSVDELRHEGNNIFYAGCGTPLSRLSRKCAQLGASGLEFAQGIPGSVGGGLVMNAGAYGGELKDTCHSVGWLRKDGSMAVISGAEAEFAYRCSLFEREGGLILWARFALKEGHREAILAAMAELAARRRQSQPLELPSAGSTFKRPQGGYAAELIERAGLKGYAIGGAQVSSKHSGFVVNRGQATYADVLALIEHIQKTVFDQSGIRLEPEVRLITGS